MSAETMRQFHVDRDAIARLPAWFDAAVFQERMEARTAPRDDGAEWITRTEEKRWRIRDEYRRGLYPARVPRPRTAVEEIVHYEADRCLSGMFRFRLEMGDLWLGAMSQRGLRLGNTRARAGFAALIETLVAAVRIPVDDLLAAAHALTEDSSTPEGVLSRDLENVVTRISKQREITHAIGVGDLVDPAAQQLEVAARCVEVHQARKTLGAKPVGASTIAEWTAATRALDHTIDSARGRVTAMETYASQLEVLAQQLRDQDQMDTIEHLRDKLAALEAETAADPYTVEDIAHASRIARIAADARAEENR